MISSALSFEAEDRLEESVAAYRSWSCQGVPFGQVCNNSFCREAIGKLLSEVQGDPDVTRQAQVFLILKKKKSEGYSFVFYVGEETNRAVHQQG